MTDDEIAAFNKTGRRYDRIFLYFTDPEYEPVLKRFRDEERDHFLDGRNALTYYYIAEIHPPPGR